jgi:hypothetical protein
MSLPHRLPRVLGVNVGDLGTCQGSREPPYALRWSSGLTQSLSQRSHVAYALPHPPPRGDRLSGVPAMLVVAVVRPLGSECIRQRLLPVTAGERHAERVLAPHRAARRRCRPGQCPPLSAVVRAGYSTGRTCDAEFRHSFGLAFAAHIPDRPALAEFNFSIMAFSFAAKVRP